MIVADIKDAERYAALHPGFAAAFAFLKERRGEGKYALKGEDIFAIVSDCKGRGKKASPLEVHRRYIDIQYIQKGTDTIGWKPLGCCHRETASFDQAKDIGFFADEPESWLELAAGEFAVFFPEDAHAPLAGAGEVSKIVVKIAVDGGR
jgi:YhcH/YjgK/YiaL family protein